MDQVVGEAAELGSRFERQLREKARQHHELGVQLREVGAQLRLEKAKQDKFYKVCDCVRITNFSICLAD